MHHAVDRSGYGLIFLIICSWKNFFNISFHIHMEMNFFPNFLNRIHDLSDQTPKQYLFRTSGLYWLMQPKMLGTFLHVLSLLFLDVNFSLSHFCSFPYRPGIRTTDTFQNLYAIVSDMGRGLLHTSFGSKFKALKKSPVVHTGVKGRSGSLTW